MILFDLIRKLRWVRDKSKFASFGEESVICYPFDISHKESCYIGNHVLIQRGMQLISHKGEFHVGNCSAIGSDCIVVTDAHAHIVGIPYRFCGHYHLRDKPTTVSIGDDCSIGTRVSLLPGAKVNRGAVVGAGSIVNKEIPPYAIAVGSPAKVIAMRFSVEQIKAHENKIYDKKDRLSIDELKEIEANFGHLRVVSIGELNADEEKLVKVHLGENYLIK